MSRYLVKDKFTYERVPQTDYSYNPDYLPYCGLTDVSVAQRHAAALSGGDLLALGDPTVAGDTPADMALTGAVQEVLSRSLRSARSDRPKAASYTAPPSSARRESPSPRSAPPARVTPISSRCPAWTLRRCGSGWRQTARRSLHPFPRGCVEHAGRMGRTGALLYAGERRADRPRLCHGADRGRARRLCQPESALDPGGCYSMLMPRRNTVFVILSNPDGLASATLSFTSEAAPDYLPENAVTLPCRRTRICTPCTSTFPPAPVAPGG